MAVDSPAESLRTLWKPTETAKSGVALFKFTKEDPQCLSLSLGETVQISEECQDWYRGCSLRNRNVIGIFPAAFIHLKDCSVQKSGQNEKVTNRELPILEEVTSVLREWGAIWKSLYVKRESHLFQTVRKLMMELMNWRRHIISGTLTADQIKQMKRQIANKIDFGNKLLGLDLVVRDTEGNVVNLEDTGVVELYKRHVESSQRTQTTLPRPQSGGVPSYASYTTHNLYLSIKNVVCKIGDDAEVYITLYDGRQNIYISEHYLVRWDRQGLPKDLEKLNNLSCLFTDLESKDLQRDRLFIVCLIIRDGRMDIKDADSKKFTQHLRRPFGVAVLYISDVIQGKTDDDDDKEYFLQLHQCANDEFLDQVIRKSIAKDTTERQSSDQGIWISFRLLHGDVNQVREEHPLLMTKMTAIARKIGFPDVIFPGDLRNDIYITILTGSFERGAKSANKNIEVTLAVYTAEGLKVDGVVSLGAGEDLTSEYSSCIYYHSANPKWMETVKLCVPIEKMNGAHIRFTFKHRATYDEKDKAQKITSFAYVNLMKEDGTALQDCVHDLAVYKCDTKKIEDANIYFKLPSLRQDALSKCTQQKKSFHVGGFTFSKNEMFQISFKLCSTKLAQNVDLLGLLKWRSQKDKLPQILPAMMKVSGEEIVKFLQDTFDALFAILMDNPEKYGEMVSDAVVFCIGLLADKKYHQFRPVLDAYIMNLFSATKAYMTLTSVLQQHIELSNKSDSKMVYDRLLNYFKAAEYIVKFIVRSRMLSEKADPGKGRMEFDASINSLFSAIVNMMMNTSNDTLLVQGCALKYVPAMFGDLLEVYDPVHLGYFARDLIERISPGRLKMHKLTCIHQMVKSPLFSIQDARAIVLPMVVSQLKIHLDKMEELKICVDILNDLLTTFTKPPQETGNTDDDIAHLVNNLFRDVVKCVIRMDRGLALVGNYVACIVCVLDVMKDGHYAMYIESFPNDSELLDCLMELFLVFREFIDNSVYPKDWISMTMVQNQDILRAIDYFSEALYDRFLVGESFELQLWNNFFQLAISFITQESLQLENFSETKRERILEKYGGDMRMSIGRRVVELWQLLGMNKIRLIPEMVGPFLEMTLIPEAELRKATIPIFFDMIECEFRNRQNFRQVESEVISQLDVLVEGGKGDEEYKTLFNEILIRSFRLQQNQNQRLGEVGLSFVDTITRLLSRLLDYRTVTDSEENINNRMSCSVNILYFYKEIKREEMYIRYLYKLCDLHLSVENYTEAAFTLLLHADLLNWSEDPLSNIHQVKYRTQTQRQLKEILYKDVIDYFDKGKTWEYGIRLCKELAQQYEAETYDYVQLSQILEKEARFFDNIIKTLIRAEPEYFRVAYYGRGCPSFLRNKVFIYRGNQYEKLHDFMMRLQSQFPNAQFLKTLEKPGEDILNSSGQYLQVCTVHPVPVERRRFRGKAVAEQIRKFYEVNDINQFALSRPFHKGKKDKECEFKTLWVERTTMLTQYSFPGILRWFEVTSMQMIELSPVENALETMKSKNKEIQSILGRYKADLKANINPLSMLLNGVIDAAVMGGISNYEKAFFVEEYLAKNPGHRPYMEQLKELIIDQVDLLQQGLVIHKHRAPEGLRPFHEKMEKCFKDMKSKILPYRKQRDKTRKAFEGDRRSIMVHSVSPFNQGRTGSRLDQSPSEGSLPPLPEKIRHQPPTQGRHSGTLNLNNRRATIMGDSQFRLDSAPVLEKRRSPNDYGTSPSGALPSGTAHHLKHNSNSGSPPLPSRSSKSPSLSQCSPSLVNGSDVTEPPPKPSRESITSGINDTPPPMLPQKARSPHSQPAVNCEPLDQISEPPPPPVPPRGKTEK